MCATGPNGPTNLSDEDLVVLFRNGTHQEQEDAACELSVRIHRIARRVVQHRPVGKQCKCDFEEEMPAEILEKLERVDDPAAFDPARGCFAGWCFVVLLNRSQDWVGHWFRQYGREESLPPDWLEPSAPPVAPPAAEPFSARELGLLGQMSSLQRVICVSTAGWSLRVPEEVWQQWLEDVHIEPPFPPPEIFVIDKPTKRLPLLAKALGKKWTAIRLDWYRGRKSEPFLEVSRGHVE